jgi:hypothetical protein
VAFFRILNKFDVKFFITSQCWTSLSKWPKLTLSKWSKSFSKNTQENTPIYLQVSNARGGRIESAELIYCTKGSNSTPEKKLTLLSTPILPV